MNAMQLGVQLFQEIEAERTGETGDGKSVFQVR